MPKKSPDEIFFMPVVAINWRITTGGDNRRSDSIVSVVTVMKTGVSYTAQLEPGTTWANDSVQPPAAQPPFKVGSGGNNGPGVVGNGFVVSNNGDIDHVELHFKSHAEGLESTDNWNVKHITVTKTISFDGIFDEPVFDGDFGENGLRMKGLGSYSIPWK